ncbi:MAG: hypothetical protein B6I20_01510 [Bacteroidetes bacterium 4572_117]|nr:MAG: hypothetical protein B6I20_01510 [Bacteroidetes bacterium 4572_117]
MMKTEKKKKRLNKKLSRIIDSAYALYEIVYNETGIPVNYKFLDVNPLFEKISGLLKKDIIGKNTGDIIPINSVDIIKKYTKTVKTGKSRTFEYNFGEYQAIYKVKVSKLSKNKIISVFYDISDKKKLEQDLIIAEEKAKQSDKLKTSFLSHISHEIRTPLNAIVGFSDFLGEDINDEDKRLYSEIIKNSSNDLLNIITDILDIAKIESGHTKMTKEGFSVNQLMSELYEYFQYKKNKLNKNHIAIKYKQRLTETKAVIISDKNRVKQVMVNLLENAFKFTSEGFIEFGANLNEKKKILELFVSDSGIGISKEKQKFIFDSFRQADESTSRVFGGTGLGLSISRGLARLIGGDLFMKSKEGPGSQFIFQIPYLPVETKKDSLLDVKKSFNIPKGKKILVVEDIYSNFELVNGILEPYKLKIIHAYSGLEAIKLFKTNIDTDIIMMDMRLPDIDGFEVTSIIKNIKPDVPIIALTAFATKSDKDSAIDAGCDDFLVKPFKIEMLLQAIEKHL